jgi:hypothetical protein
MPLLSHYNKCVDRDVTNDQAKDPTDKNPPQKKTNKQTKVGNKSYPGRNGVGNED